MRHACFFLIVLSLAGCAPADTGAGPGVSPVTVGGLDSLRAAGRGRVLLINVWATWCQPCMSELPGLVRIRRDFADKGVELVLISTDDPDDVDSVVIPTLGKLGVDFGSYILTGRDDDAFIRSMHPDWPGALPASFIYDRTGRLTGWFMGERTYESFATEIRTLLDE